MSKKKESERQGINSGMPTANDLIKDMFDNAVREALEELFNPGALKNNKGGKKDKIGLKKEIRNR